MVRKIDEEIKEQVRNDYASGNYSYRKLVEKYNLSLNSVQRIMGKLDNNEYLNNYMKNKRKEQKETIKKLKNDNRKLKAEIESLNYEIRKLNAKLKALKN